MRFFTLIALAAAMAACSDERSAPSVDAAADCAMAKDVPNERCLELQAQARAIVLGMWKYAPLPIKEICSNPRSGAYIAIIFCVENKIENQFEQLMIGNDADSIVVLPEFDIGGACYKSSQGDLILKDECLETETSTRGRLKVFWGRLPYKTQVQCVVHMYVMSPYMTYGPYSEIERCLRNGV